MAHNDGSKKARLLALYASGALDVVRRVADEGVLCDRTHDGVVRSTHLYALGTTPGGWGGGFVDGYARGAF